MADETLSLELSAAEVQQFIASLQQAKEAIEGLQQAAARSGLESLQTAAERAGAALANIGVTVGPQVDPGPTEELADASERAAQAGQAMGDAAQEAMNKISDGAGKAARDVGGLSESFGRVSSVALGTAVGVAGGITAVAVARKAIQELKDVVERSVQEFVIMEQSVLKLSAAFVGMGDFSKAAIDDMRDFAGALQQTTVFGDDAIITLAAIIAQLGQLEGSELKRATRAAVNLSEVMGIDLTTAGLLVAKAAQGLSTSLSRYGLVIDETIPRAERFSVLLDKIERQFGETARLSALGASGAIRQLSNAFGDFLKQVGGRLLQGLEPTMRRLISLFLDLSEKIAVNSAEAVDARSNIDGLIKSFNALAEAQESVKRVGLARGDISVPGIDFGQLQQASAQAARVAEEARQEIESRFETLKIQVPFVIAGGSIEEIRSILAQVERLRKASLVPEPESEKDLQRLKELDIMVGDLRRGVQGKIRFDLRESLESIERLRDLVKPPLRLGATLITDQVERDLQNIKDKLDLKFEATILFPRVFDQEEIRRQAGDPFLDVDIRPQLKPEEVEKLEQLIGDIEIAATLKPHEFEAVVDALKKEMDKQLKIAVDAGPEADAAALKFVKLNEALEKLEQKRKIFFDTKQADILGQLLRDLIQLRGRVEPVELMEAEELAKVRDANELMARIGQSLELLKGQTVLPEFDPTDLAQAFNLLARADKEIVEALGQGNVALTDMQKALIAFASTLTTAAKDAQLLGEFLREAIEVRGGITGVEIVDIEQLTRAQDVQAILERIRDTIKAITTPVAGPGIDLPFLEAEFADPARLDELYQKLVRIRDTPLVLKTEGAKQEIEDLITALRDFLSQMGAVPQKTNEATTQVANAFRAMASIIQSIWGSMIDIMLGQVKDFAGVVKSILRSVLQVLLNIGLRSIFLGPLSAAPVPSPVQATTEEIPLLGKIGPVDLPEATLEIVPHLGTLIIPPATMEIMPRLGEIALPEVTQTVTADPFSAPVIPAFENALAQFQRLADLQAQAAFQRPVILREREPVHTLPQPTAQVFIEATDGISVRRQLTSGALRQELARELRRSGV